VPVTVTITVPNTSTVLGLVDTTAVTATSVLSPALVKQVVDTTLVPRLRLYLPLVMRNG
jgi:hypothetical protein